MPDRDDDSDDEKILKGLGLLKTIKDHGYGFLLDKIDWVNMIFCPEHANHMLFANPSLFTTQRRRYQEVQQVLDNWLRIKAVNG